MIELTNENVKVDDEYPYYISIWCGNEEGTVKTISQILDDYEKAREWDNLALDKEDKDIALHGAKLIKQNQKLRELIKKEIESGQDGRIQSSSMFLQKLLEESKK